MHIKSSPDILVIENRPWIIGGMDEGIHPFVTAYLSGRGSHRSTDAVNDWLDAART